MRTRIAIGVSVLALILALPTDLNAAEPESLVSAEMQDAPDYLEPGADAALSLGKLVDLPAERAAVRQEVDLHALNGRSSSAAAAPLQPRSTRPQARMQVPPWPPRYAFHAPHRFASSG